MNIEDVIAKVKDLPTIPVVAARILRLSEKEDSTVEEMVKAIQLDPSVSGRILKAANSAYYSCPRTVTTVKNAIILIGFNTVKAISVAASVKDLYKPFGLAEKLLWDHSIHVAHTAQELALRSQAVNKDEAFMAGLFHDIGYAIMNRAEPELFGELVSEAWNSGKQTYELESGYFDFSHAELGAAILESWKLPSELAMAARYHHAPLAAESCGKQARLLATITGLADSIARKNGGTAEIPAAIKDACSFIGIDAVMIDSAITWFVNSKDEISASYCD